MSTNALRALRERALRASRTGTPRSHDAFVTGLRVFWILVVFWGELGLFSWSVSGCRWPDKVLRHSNPGANSAPTHVLLIADPQVLDHRSYPGRSNWLMRLTQFVVDFNLRKSWRVARSFRPHVAVFLGDMMDSGRYNMGDREYEEYFQRYKKIFELSKSIPVHYLVGNHDIGLGYSRSFSTRARQRFTSHFGPLHKFVSIANHTFVFIDAPGLVEEDYQRSSVGVEYDKWKPLPNGAVEFVKNVSAKQLTEPAILFTHIPMHRPDTASCGPLRERGTIRRGVGHGYQNTLGKQTTRFLFESIRPSVVFGGDDHDYCEYIHVAPNGVSSPPVREVTVKSFSMAMGIRNPGFQLLSLLPPSTSSSSQSTTNLTHADVPCFLPNQIRIYTSFYTPLVFITLLALLFANLRRRRRLKPLATTPLLSFPNGNGTGISTGNGINTANSDNGDFSAFLHPPDSAIWSDEATRSPQSPLSRLPSKAIRGPNNTTANNPAPALRAYSRPSTPLSSITPLDSPALVALSGTRSMYEEEEEDGVDEMYPVKYGYDEKNATTGAGMGPGVGVGVGGEPTSYFLPAPGSGTALAMNGHNSRKSGAWTWSWTFVLRGRRRRMTARVPDVVVGFVSGLMRVFGRSQRGMGDLNLAGRRRSLLRAFLGDVLKVVWPALLSFVLITWWTFL